VVDNLRPNTGLAVPDGVTEKLLGVLQPILASLLAPSPSPSAPPPFITATPDPIPPDGPLDLDGPLTTIRVYTDDNHHFFLAVFEHGDLGDDGLPKDGACPARVSKVTAMVDIPYTGAAERKQTDL
jgi:hypothetical protein